MGEQNTKRIGLVLASIHTGASNSLWSQIAKQAQRSEYSLFVFPGGRLEHQENQEFLRNTIYPLVNTDNLDGIITWASALGGSVSVEEVQAFLDTLSPLSCVCIGMKREGCPGISFDAYSGIQSVMLHCIREHQARKLAFIRGPENHYSSGDRYRAYCDTLEQTGLNIDPRLVSDPFAWSDGKHAIMQLLHERNLVPGKDFDTLVCSSDLMMFDAGKYLQSLGYSIPEDLKIVGYNDTRESHLLKVPCTTARMPVRDMAQMSWNAMVGMLEDKETSCFDLLLPSHPIIRQSCGCTYSLGSEEQAQKEIGSLALYRAWMIQAFNAGEVEQQLLESLLDAASINDENQVLLLVEKLCYEFLDRGGDPSLLSEALHWYSKFFGSVSFKEQTAEKIRDLFLRQRDLVAHEHAYDRSVQASILDNLKCDLLGVRSLSSIPGLLAKHLVPLGLEAGYLVLHAEENESTFVGGYAKSLVMDRPISFPKHLLLPQSLMDHLGKGVHVVEPLFMDNQPLGYLVLRTTLFSGNVMEDLRTALNSAIKGAFLFDAANHAREEAEKAQRSRSEFFANVGEGLKAPLEEILALSANLDPDLKKKIALQLRSANNLLELSLSHSGSLELEPKVCNPRELFDALKVEYQGSDLLPALFVDTQRLKQSIGIITQYIKEEGGAVRLDCRLLSQGLEFCFSSSSKSFKSSLGKQDPSLSLAQRIVLMSQGSFHYRDNTITLTLPWPSLKAQSNPGSVSTVFYIADDEQTEVPEILKASFPNVQLMKVSSLERKDLDKLVGGIIGWDANNQGRSFQLFRNMLAAHNTLSTAPMICFNAPSGHQSLASSLISNHHPLQEGVVVVVKGLLEQVSSLLTLEERFVIRCEASEVLTVVSNQTVALLVSDAFDPLLYTQVRKLSNAPIVIIRETWGREESEQLCLIPRLIIAHHCVLDSSEFNERLLALMETKEVLPALTGALVKRAIVYLGKHATEPISRWQLAESVNVSEDYLTRIFRKEIGLSPWDYLNRQRIHLATILLEQSALSINEVASQTGFQDQAYFCRVFRKIKGCAPGKIRSQH